MAGGCIGYAMLEKKLFLLFEEFSIADNILLLKENNNNNSNTHRKSYRALTILAAFPWWRRKKWFVGGVELEVVSDGFDDTWGKLP